MGTTNDNQDITSEAPKLLLCSSIASASDPGSNAVTKPQAGIGKEHPELSWYYMYLPYKELKRYIAVFSGRKAVKLRTSEGITEECYFCFKVFSYTEAGHRKRFEQCDYTKQEYNKVALKFSDSPVLPRTKFPPGQLLHHYIHPADNLTR